jgi:ABC-2 type transport system permease protein
MREPLGFIFSVGMPVFLFILFGRMLGSRNPGSERLATMLSENIPIFIAVFIAISASLSLVAVISIYREGGILKRLRATPLRPPTILLAHVAVKLIFTALTFGIMVLAGRRFYPVSLEFDATAFVVALLFSTTSIISLGFVIASAVPTARFAQPIGSAILYPMLALSGIFAPVDALPTAWAALARILPVTHAVSLLRGAWNGAGWLAHLPDLGALALTIVICTVISARIFRWE